MKKVTLRILTFLIFSLNMFAQTVIENPENPLSKNAGRVIKLKKVMQIKDEGREFYFKSPFHIKTAKDGTIYVQERSQLHKFNADGKFEKNLIKRGQGPGELSGILSDFILGDNEIVLFSSNASKVIRIDMDGNLLEDFKLEDIFANLIGYYRNNYFLTKYVWGERKRETGIREQKIQLVRVDSREGISPTHIFLPITVSTYWSKRASGSISISRIQTLNKSQKYVYLFHTPSYLVKLLDLENAKIIQSFRRKYLRVKEQTIIDKKKNPHTPPLPKYKNDIYRILIHNNNLWVVTQTFDNKKGLLVDVFSFEGKYLDNFYLPLLSAEKNDWIYAPMAAFKNFIFVIEGDKDGFFSVVKYEIID